MSEKPDKTGIKITALTVAQHHDFAPAFTRMLQNRKTSKMQQTPCDGFDM